ncbi:MAG: alpha/beta hydrolase family protein [Promethearchaeota archaeon]
MNENMRVEFQGTAVGRDEGGYYIEMPLNADGTVTDKVYVDEIFEEYEGKTISLAVGEYEEAPRSPLFEGELAREAAEAAKKLDLKPEYAVIRDDLNIYNWLRAQYLDVSRSRKMSFEAVNPGTPAEVFGWRDELRPKIEELLGFPFPGAELDVEYGPEVEFDGLVMKKVYFQSQPGLKVPAVLSYRKDLDGPAPGVLCLHGHNQGKICTLGFHYSSSDSYWGYQLAKRGFVTLSPDQFGWGERFGVAKRRYAESEKVYSRSALLLGTNSIGIRTWDAKRGLDFLESLDIVDPGRLGVIGHSGGGMIANFTAPLDDRVKAVVVSGYFCRWLHSIFTIHHCICNFVPGILELADCEDVLAMAVPRHVFVVSGIHDNIFPQVGVQEAYKVLEKVYETAGFPDRVGIDVVEGVGHFFSGRKAYPWLERVLEVNG